MADSVVEIVNTTLTSTELPDSTTSYDLITTDANTSYVIKDIQVSGGVTDLQAEINDFPVGNWAQNLTGSEIIDTSSTVSVTSQDFPFSFDAFNVSTLDGVSGESYSGDIYRANGTAYSTDWVTEDRSAYSDWSGYATSATDSVVMWMYKDGTKLYQIYQNNNSTAQFRYWSTTGSSYTQLNNGASYHQAIPDIRNNKVYYLSNSPSSQSLYVRDLTTHTSTFLKTLNMASFSSYCRMAICKNYIFVVPSSSFSSNATSYAMCAYSIDGGHQVLFNGSGSGIGGAFSGASNFDYGSDTRFFVSYDETTDKFHFYFTYSSSTNQYVGKSISDITKTVMDGYGSDTTGATGTFQGIGNLSAYSALAYNGGIANYCVGDETDGNKFYYITSSTTGGRSRYLYSATWATSSGGSDEQIADSGTASYSSSILSYYEPTAAEVAASPNGENQGKLKIRITGVETTS